MEQEKQTDYRFKILYAVGIIMVVAGHCNGGGFSLLSDWFPYGGFHLALFVFCSGYFYSAKAEKDLLKHTAKNIRSLIIPLYVYNLIYGLLVILLKKGGFAIGEDFTPANVLIAPITNGHQFVYNMGGWFVVPLFMVKVLTPVFRRAVGLVFKNASEWLFFTAALALGILGNQLACGGYNTGWWLAIVRMLYFVPFYGLGILYRRKLEAYDRKISSFPYFTAVLAIKLILTIHCGHSPVYTISWCSDFTEGPVMPIVIGYLGIAFWMRMANLLEPLIGKSRWINLIADNTFSIMMNQFLGFMAVKSVYAALSKYAGFFSDFDQACYRTNIWYYYTPKGLEQSLILYTAAGILIPILIQKTIDLAKRTALSKIKSRKVNIQS